MNNLTNHEHGGDTDTVHCFVDRTSEVDVGVIEIFRQTFFATHKVVYLETAIRLAKELYLRDEGILLLLNHLLEIQEQRPKGDCKTAISGHPMKDSMVQKSSQRFSVGRWSVEPIKVVQGFLDKFRSTQEIDYLSKEVHIIEALSLPGKNLQSLLAEMIRILLAHSSGDKSEYPWLNLGGVLGDDGSDSGGPCVPEPTISMEVSRASLESIRFIWSALNTFHETNAIDHLNNAIELAQRLVQEDKGVLPLLEYMFRVRDGNLKGGKMGIRVHDRNLVPDPTWNEIDDQIGGSFQAAEPGLWNAVTARLITQLRKAFEETCNIKYLDAAIEIVDKLVALALSDSKLQYSRSLLVSLLRIKHDSTGEAEYQRMILNLLEEGIAVTPLDHPARLQRLVELGNNYHVSYKQSGAHEDLEKAIVWAGRAVKAVHVNDPEMPEVYARFSMNLFERSDSLEDLELVIGHLEKALAAIHPEYPEHPDRPIWICALGEALRARYTLLTTLEDIEKAIERFEEGLAAMPANYDARLSCLHALGRALATRYERLSTIEDLEKALERLEEGLAAMPANHDERLSCLQALGRALMNRYERLSTLEDLEKALERFGEGLAAIPANHNLRPAYLVGLSKALGLRYEHLRGVGDLQNAIKWAKEALATTEPDHPDYSMLCTCMCRHLHERFHRFGDLEDLQQTVKWAEQSLIKTPNDNPGREIKCSNLGVVLMEKYSRLGVLEDLLQAVKWSEEAVQTIIPNHSDRATAYSNLSTTLTARYSRLGDPDDLQQAIRYAKEAIRITPSNTSRQFHFCTKLSKNFVQRYDLAGELKDLEQAFELAERNLTAIPLDHPQRQAALHCMSKILFSRYKLSALPADLDQAIKYMRDILAITPLGSLNRAYLLLCESNMIVKRYEQTDSTDDFYHLLQRFYEAWNCQMSPPQARIRAAVVAVSLLERKKRWADCVSLLADSIRILPKVGSRILGRGDQEYHLSDFTQLASRTISIALLAGEEASYCLKLLELSRGVIMGLVIDCRSDLSELRLQHPQLFSRFDNLRRQIDSPPDETEVDRYTSQREQRRQQEAIHQMEMTLSAIRNLPGFEGFQLPPHSEDLIAMANEGPIIICNSTKLRSDAIIITRSSIQALPLPKLVFSSAMERMNHITQFTRGTRKTYKRRNEGIEELLLWLWDVVVEPIFNFLKLEAPVHGVELPRVWWIGVGVLAMAPFHAAGDHSPGSTRNTISRAISSYTPTIKALSYAREKELGLLRPNSRLLLVNTPTTPGHNPLKNSTAEVREIASIVKGKILTTHLDHPSTADVLAELPSCHAIHFACHGLSNEKNPSSSHLLLRSRSGTVDQLTVESISKSNVKLAQIAYLSACSTANNSSHLRDESIYIASAFQLAGFSHVLATQWVSNDRACQQVASDFYASLVKAAPAGGKEGHEMVSAAFHFAIQKLRNENLRRPILWAPFIHTGA